MGFEEEVHHAQEIDAARRRRAGEPDLIPPLPEWHLILVSELVKHGIRKVPIFVVVKSRIKKTLRFESHTTDWFTRVDEAWAIDLRQPEEGGTFSYLFLISPGSLTRGSWISAQTSDVTSGGARYRRVTHRASRSRRIRRRSSRLARRPGGNVNGYRCRRLAAIAWCAVDSQRVWELHRGWPRQVTRERYLALEAL